jgi:hypothetical protein
MHKRILTGRWCHIIVLNVHAPTEDKIHDVKDSFYEELERDFDKFQKYHMKILLGDFNAKVGKDEIIGDHQCGFRRNRSTTDQIFCIRQLLEKKWEYNETVHQLFIDFRKGL